jgi:hypothetical protein
MSSTFLEPSIKLSDGLFFVNALIALQAEEGHAISARDRLSEFRFTRASRSLEQNWAIDPAR